MRKFLILLKCFLTGRGIFYIHYGITHRCNLKCIMCGLWRQNTSSELPTKDIMNLARLIGRGGVYTVSIGGGEPLLRDDLVDFVSELRLYGIRTRVLTNGVTPDFRIFKDLKNAGVREFSVSLDSLDHVVQDEICGEDGTLKRIKESIKIIRNIYRKERSVNLLNTTISGKNLANLPELVSFAHEIGFGISFIPLECEEWGPHRLAKGSSELRIDGESKKITMEIMDKIINMKKKGFPVFNSSTYLENATFYLLTGVQPKMKCHAGSMYLSISPSGEISYCHLAAPFSTVENVIKDNSILVKFTKDYLERAENFRKNCNGCLRPCWQEPSQLMRNPRAFTEMIKIMMQERSS